MEKVALKVNNLVECMEFDNKTEILFRKMIVL